MLAVAQSASWTFHKDIEEEEVNLGLIRNYFLVLIVFKTGTL